MYRLIIPHPPKSIGANTRAHWRKRAADVAKYRNECTRLFLDQTKGARPKWRRAAVVVVWMSKTRIHPDPVNLYQYLKGAFDALQDAEIIINDKHLWPERPIILTRQATAAIVLYVEEEKEE